jgi:hypothetical protein
MAITNSSRQFDARLVATDVESSSATKDASNASNASKKALHTAPCGACSYCSDTCQDATTCVDYDRNLTAGREIPRSRYPVRRLV